MIEVHLGKDSVQTITYSYMSTSTLSAACKNIRWSFCACAAASPPKFEHVSSSICAAQLVYI